MKYRKCTSFKDGHGPATSVAPLNFSLKVHTKAQFEEPSVDPECRFGADVDIDLKEIYFLIMHFLSTGPCQMSFGHLLNELLENQLLPRRYHAWYSRGGESSGDANDNGISFPLSYDDVSKRYPHIEKDHLVKLLKQLIRMSPVRGIVERSTPGAADVPTLLGIGSFSLLSGSENKLSTDVKVVPAYLRWPHMQADQVRGLSLREIGGGFRKHHRAPSIRFACYTIAKPSTMLQKMQNIKKLRGHRDAVYCAIFDRSGRHVITGSDDRLVKIWSMETAFCLSSCRGHEGDITDLAVSSNNVVVASASNDCSIRVWRMADGHPLSVLRGHKAAVTAIAFSPRLNSVYHLLSSSDDGSCCIWDARFSKYNPRIYLPKPPDSIYGKNSCPPSNGPSSSNAAQTHQILCCAFNSNGNIFVTGSSDTFARVWNACRPNTENIEQPIHEIDVLAGHENDVNYVQFSGCSVASRSATTNSLMDDSVPKFKNSRYSHDNIVTCSRDGSAIIWIPKRRSHGKAGRWTRAYHLKVPPPPIPPQPPRGGPRQRLLPTPRGVNMIIWSLDNRFVLAAIMDCRICVWNASDGSLVHSLTGHSGSTYVLDVHPFNPRIAMSAGYDGKTIVWDIWEGTPIRTYEIGRFKLVDGKFSPDGTSIVLSDDVGQIYLLSTGQGESQEDAKYDQFFLGDYRPLIQDTQGNVLDQETQLLPQRRNLQDPLCDSSLIPYPEPYQSNYQRRRLGALGIEWNPSTIKYTVGSDMGLGQEYQVLPLADLDIVIEPLPEFLDAMYWELENDVVNEDNDSEYNVTDECSSGDDPASVSNHSSTDPECSEEEGFDGLRRSKRKKPKPKVGSMKVSGRHIKRRNMIEIDAEISSSRAKRKKWKNGRTTSKRKSSKGKSFRPQRVSARNSTPFYSQNKASTADEEEDDEEEEEEFVTEDESSDSESLLQDSVISEPVGGMPTVHNNISNALLEESQDVTKSPNSIASQPNAGSRNKLILRFTLGNSTKSLVSENTESACANQANLTSSSSKTKEEAVQENAFGLGLGNPVSSSTSLENSETLITKSREGKEAQVVDDTDYENGKIRWGECKMRSAKRMKLEDFDVKPAIDHENPFGRNEAHKEEEKDGPDGNCEIQLKENPIPKHTILRIKSKNNSVVSKTPSKIKFINIRPPSGGDLALEESTSGESEANELPDSDGYDGERIRITRSRNHEYPESATDAMRRTRSLGLSATSRDTYRESRSRTSAAKSSKKTSSDQWTHSSANAVRSAAARDRGGAYDKESENSGTTAKLNWLLLTEQEESYRYIPQLGDEVVYIRQGHEAYAKTLPSPSSSKLADFPIRSNVEICLVKNLEYASFQGSGESCCKLTLQFIDSCSSVCGMILDLTLPELNDFTDFVVERRWYEASINRNWGEGDECRVWWKDELNVEKGGAWWNGEITWSADESTEFPGSPWLRYHVMYESVDKPEKHSPWELHDLQTLHHQPCIDVQIRNKLLSLLSKLRRSATTNQDKHGVLKIKQISQKLDFLNRYPVPLSLDVIELRLENNYYRSLKALDHDISVMLTNAGEYFAKNDGHLAKVKRLSDWFDKILTKL